MTAQITANVLPLIEEHFAFLGAEFGFALAQSTDIPSQAWFRTGDRTVVVAYDFMRDAAVEIELRDGATQECYNLAEVLCFEAGAEAARREDVRERPALAAEMHRRAKLVATCCRDFLTGDVDAFRRRYREALLVQTTRAAAMHEFYKGDPDRARRLFTGLRAYWDDRDREHFAQLATGKPLAALRAKIAR